MLALLIGARASGKTSLGRRLAATRGLAFIDLDDRVLARFQEATIRDVWAAHGESAWRAGEVAEVRRLLAEPDGPGRIVALGGGTPCIDEARSLLDTARAEGRVRIVYLRALAATLAGRLREAPGDRPVLTAGEGDEGDGVAQEVSRVLERREPTYAALADAICDNDGDEAAALTRLDAILG